MSSPSLLMSRVVFLSPLDRTKQLYRADVSGLIFDEFYVLFIFSVLVTFAAVMSRWKRTHIFFIWMAVSFIQTMKGISAFRSSHSHSHGGGHGQSHGGGHGHSHGDEDRNTNMEGVFLHVIAYTLGSVGVITSSLWLEHSRPHLLSVHSHHDPAQRPPTGEGDLCHSSPAHSIRSRNGDPKIITKNNVYRRSINVSTPPYLEPYLLQEIWYIACTGVLNRQRTKKCSSGKQFVKGTRCQVEKETYFYHLSGLGANFEQWQTLEQKLSMQFSLETTNAI